MERREKSNFLPRDRWLNVAMALGPGAWLLHLNASYMLVPETCGDGSKMILHALTAGCIALALIGAAMAWRIRVACMRESPTSLTVDRTRWTSMMIFVLSLAMVLVIIAQEIPNLILRSCD